MTVRTNSRSKKRSRHCASTSVTENRGARSALRALSVRTGRSFTTDEVLGRRRAERRGGRAAVAAQASPRPHGGGRAGPVPGEPAAAGPHHYWDALRRRVQRGGGAKALKSAKPLYRRIEKLSPICGGAGSVGGEREQIRDVIADRGFDARAGNRGAGPSLRRGLLRKWEVCSEIRADPLRRVKDGKHAGRVIDGGSSLRKARKWRHTAGARSAMRILRRRCGRREPGGGAPGPPRAGGVCRQHRRPPLVIALLPVNGGASMRIEPLDGAACRGDRSETGHGRLSRTFPAPVSSPAWPRARPIDRDHEASIALYSWRRHMPPQAIGDRASGERRLGAIAQLGVAIAGSPRDSLYNQLSAALFGALSADGRVPGRAAR